MYGTVFSKMYINKLISFLKEEVSSTGNLDVCVQYSVYYGIQLAYAAVYSKFLSTVCLTVYSTVHSKFYRSLKRSYAGIL